MNSDGSYFATNQCVWQTIGNRARRHGVISQSIFLQKLVSLRFTLIQIIFNVSHLKLQVHHINITRLVRAGEANRGFPHRLFYGIEN